MKNVYTVLLIEDQPDDAELIELQLAKSELDITFIRIQSRSGLMESLEKDKADLIICDYNLGDFTGKDVLDIVKDHSPDLPFILVSGYLGEKKAVEIMVAGADDYINKDELERLIPVVQREILSYRKSLEIQQQRDMALYDLQERVKEQQCLHQISRIDEQKFSISELLSKVVDYLPAGLQYQGITEAIIKYDGNSYQTENYRDTPWSFTATDDTIANGPLRIEVIYLEEKPVLDIGPFLNEEKYLIDSVLDILSLKINRLLDKKELDHKQELLERASDLAQIGNWEVDLVESTVMWSAQVYDIHEMEKSYEPILSEGLNFYKEGKHRETITEAFTKAVEQGIPWDLELVIVTGRGNDRWIRTIGQPVFEHGRCVRVYGSFQNIDKRKSAEMDLKRTEKKLRDILENSTNLFYRHDTNHRLTYVSPQSEHFFGCSPEEAMRSWKEFLTDHPVNKEGIKRTNQAINTGKTQPSYRLQLNKKNGEIIWVRVHEAPVVEDGQTVAMVGSLTDITELQEVLEQQKMLSKVASETKNMVIISDLDHKIEYVNSAFEKKTGYSFEEVEGKNPKLLYGPNTDPKTIAYIRKKLKIQEPFDAEILIYTKAGEHYWINLEISPIRDDYGNVVQFFSIHENITERKSFLKRLKQKRERLEEAQRIGKIGDWDFDVQTGEVFWSDQVYKIYDRDPSLAPPGYEEISAYYPEDAELHHQMVQRAVESGESYALDLKLHTEKEVEKYVHAEGFAETNENGKIVGLHGIVQDITERKEKELELAANQRQIMAVVDNIEGVLYRYILRPDGTDEMVYISSGIERLLGVPAEKAQESTEILWQLIDKRDLDRFTKSVEKSAETLQPWYEEYRIETPEGEKKWIRGTGRPTQLKDGTIQWDTMIVDITDEVRKQQVNEALVQEVHHRVKNNLAIIIGFLELQLADHNEQSPERLTLERAMTRIYSIAEVHKLLYEGSNLVDIHVNEYMDHLANHVSGTMGIDDRFDIDLQVDELHMNVNELTPLGMLMNELMTNSVKYAFNGEGQGRITIKISKDEDTYQVYYKDNGPGMDKKTFEEIQTTGLTIVKILLAQLEADYQLLNDDGFSLSFTFKEKQKGAHSNFGKQTTGV